jgi:hypothetical protein
MPEADPSDTPLHVGKEEWSRCTSREKIAARYDGRRRLAKTVDRHTTEPYWTLPAAVGWIAWRDADELASFGPAHGWTRVKQELLYDHPTSRPYAIMPIAEAWHELHDALMHSRVAAFKKDGAQLPPTFWAQFRRVPSSVDPHDPCTRDAHYARVASEEVRRLWPDSLSLPSVRWPRPPERAFLTACEALTWIGWGEARPKQRAAELEPEPIEVWGFSYERFATLICAFETGEPQENLSVTAGQARDRISRRAGQNYTLPSWPPD